jgi:multidrug efflux pump subunit AcrB
MHVTEESVHFRLIMMTAKATLLGALFLALGSATPTGSGLRRLLGNA